ncbi:MAG: PP2C family protein-serine/threonine phosphatase [Bryobacteraceae bacterium]
MAEEAISNATSGPWTAELNGVWRWHPGDDSRWASPSFDDSNWPKLTLPGLAPDAPKYWIRIPVRLGSASDPGLLLSPLANAYEVYWDGQRLGSFGRLNPKLTWSFVPRRCIFRIPRGFAAPGDHILGIRAWSLQVHRENVLAHENRVGDFPALIEARESFEHKSFHELLGSLLITVVTGFAGLYFLLLPPSISQGTAFRWFGLLLVARALFGTCRAYEFVGPLNISGSALETIALLFAGINFAVWIEFLYVLFHRRVPKILRLLQILVIISALACIVDFPAYRILFWVVVGYTNPVVSFVALIFASIELRRGSPAAGTTLFAFTLTAIASVVHLLSEMLHFPVSSVVNLGGFWFSYWDTALFLWIPAVAIHIQKNNLRFRDERERLRGEMEAARQVQELLVPAHSVQAPGFSIDASYQPATEVGGDFFQLFPAPGDSLLVVVGDVSGKGMKAALLVSVIVGALRNRKSDRPSEVLGQLNSVLLDQSKGGFTTCCSALFTPDGTLTIANAGHLAPYRNGREIETPPGLPLGVAPDASWEETRMELQPNDRIVWISDGVVEARNGKRDLLGFERAQELATQTASEIARAAQQFGQDDDITVLSVTRQPVAAYVA